MNDEIRNQLSSLCNTLTPYIFIISRGYVTELCNEMCVMRWKDLKLLEKMVLFFSFFFFPHGFVKFLIFLLTKG